MFGAYFLPEASSLHHVKPMPSLVDPGHFPGRTKDVQDRVEFETMPATGDVHLFFGDRLDGDQFTEGFKAGHFSMSKRNRNHVRLSAQ